MLLIDGVKAFHNMFCPSELFQQCKAFYTHVEAKTEKRRCRKIPTHREIRLSVQEESIWSQASWFPTGESR